MMKESEEIRIFNQVIAQFHRLKGDSRTRLIAALSALFDSPSSSRSEIKSGSVIFAPRSSERKVPYSQSSSISPKQFLLEKQPKTDVERIACLAYYLTNFRETPHFKTIDLSKLNTEAAQARLSNPNYATKNALSYGYLAPATKGQRQLSAAGEQFVNLLPDRTAAREAMLNLLRRRKTKARSKKRK